MLLLVDDDEDAHFFLKRHLKRCGITHPTESVYDGESALRHFRACLDGTRPFPALVFLDIKMPGMTGLEVLAWAQKQDILGKLTLTMLSSSDDPRDVTAAMSLGAHTYLTKPPADEALKELVRSALRLAHADGAGPTGGNHHSPAP